MGASYTRLPFILITCSYNVLSLPFIMVNVLLSDYHYSKGSLCNLSYCTLSNKSILWDMGPLVAVLVSKKE